MLSEYSRFNVPVDNIFDDVKILDEKFQEVKNIYITLILMITKKNYLYGMMIGLQKLLTVNIE